ncbi:MAG: hypothetical protein ACJA2Y_000243 [Cycloclasticus pugetii]
MVFGPCRSDEFNEGVLVQLSSVNRPTNLALIRFYGVKRKLIWRVLSNYLGVYLVAEYPKSGGTWYAQMLADYLELPFPRNTLKPSFKKCVLHGHEMPSNHLTKCSVVLRDGRDIMVSFYYHHLFYNEWNHHVSVDKHRRNLNFKNFDDITENLPVFIEYMNTNWAKKINHFSWSEFVNSWLINDSSHAIVKYEDLLADPLETMVNSLKNIGIGEINRSKLFEIVNKHSFENLSGRKKGDENKSSFVRKGIAGDWKNHFSKEAKEIFHYYSGEALILSSYEKDDEWVSGS